MKPVVSYDQYLRIFQTYGDLYDDQYSEFASRRISEGQPKTEVVREVVREVPQERESVFTEEELKAFENLRMLEQPYVKIAKAAIQAENKNDELEVDNAIQLELNKKLGQVIDEKEAELVDKRLQVQTKQTELDAVSKQLIEEKGRVIALKKLYRKEIQRRKDLITSTIQSEKEIDSELESS